MKTLNLFLKMHFTSLSPDGQPVSLAIVTEEYFNEEYQKYYTDKVEIEKGNCSIDHLITKSFYAEFSDFDINRCDDFVKENVLSKLSPACETVKGDSERIKSFLTSWLTQFSDYKLNFIVDCGWFTWYKFVELMAEWNEFDYKANGIAYIDSVKTGLPKLPANFPPVPIDLNDLIMERKGFKSVADAFNVDREELAYPNIDLKYLEKWTTGNFSKGNALWDVKTTKAIYEKLK